MVQKFTCIQNNDANEHLSKDEEFWNSILWSDEYYKKMNSLATMINDMCGARKERPSSPKTQYQL